MEIQKIKEYDIKDLFIFLTPYSQSVIDKLYGLLNNTFKRAVLKKIIASNPLDDTFSLPKPKSKKVTKKVKGFPIADHKKLVESILTEYEKPQKNQNIAYKYQLLIALLSGMRMGEIDALDKDVDLNFTTKKITVRRTLTRDINDKIILGEVTKTVNGARVLDMDEQLERLLREYIDNYWQPNPYNLLFWDTRKKGFFATSQVNSVFKRLCKKYEINKGYGVNQHQLRHTFATRNIEAGMPANVLAKIMGHANMKTTLEIYCDVFEEYERTHTHRTRNYYIENDLLIYKESVPNNDLSPEELERIAKAIKRLNKQDVERIRSITKLAA